MIAHVTFAWSALCWHAAFAWYDLGLPFKGFLWLLGQGATYHCHFEGRNR